MAAMKWKSKLCAVLLTPLASCASDSDVVRPAPFARNKCLAPVPDYGSTLIVSQPRGWHLNREGHSGLPARFDGPVPFMGTKAIIVLSTEGDHLATRTASQAIVYARALRNHSKAEIEDVTEHNRTIENKIPA